MNADAPISLVTAAYGSREEAAEDFTTVWAGRDQGGFHHTALAVVTHDDSGAPHLDRHDSTAKHLTWGGALLGGGLFVLAQPVGVELLAVVGLSGAGAMIYHFRRNTDPLALAAAGALLEQAAAGLVVVVVNRRGDLVTPLLARARRSASVDLLWGDLEEELYRDLATHHDPTHHDPTHHDPAVRAAS
jgi:hypothetical protein